MKKSIVSFFCVILTLAILLCAVSCSSINATELSADYTRIGGEGQKSEDFLMEAADFSLSLFGNTLKADGTNQLLSPFSALMCLALVYNGADGETLSQMEQVLGMSPEVLNQSLYAYTKALSSTDECRMEYANSIWFRDTASLAVKEDFLQTNANWYGAQIYKAPFDKTTASDINDWCRKNTDGMIDKIVDNIPQDVLMYLVNALVFDAKWEEKYENNDIRDRTFRGQNGTSTLVDMMYSEEQTYLEGEGFRGFAKDYKGKAYSFVGLLPEEGTDIYEFAAGLDGEMWMQMWETRIGGSFDVGIPEFTSDSELDLTEALTAMGMELMFDSAKADFSELGSYDGGNIYCGGVKQKTYIEVNRHGTKAAAITWAIMCTESAPAISPVILDRPFVYAIVDNATGLPLFIGVVANLR